MDITGLSATQKYTASRAATEATGESGGGEALHSLAKDFAATLKESEEVAMSAMTGTADPHALVQALAQTELAVEAAITVRDRVVEAYQEILRMPV
ncbi:flagellar hook-basal body complex protein FliE [uncultured Roseovarius sp.]|uniref:flagellar hook-basal body complex protein FliE n=1 Tax=uncultured Roseovarius sp. TaxID=293344 RepID=UPI0026236C36|nr:flagellar hook-basal body complex protein FliE [uncultured Roseovarius sp.]